MHGMQGIIEHDAIELGDHLSLAKSTEITTVGTGRALAVLACNSGKVGTGFNLPLQFEALGLILDQNMSGAGSGHKFRCPVIQKGKNGNFCVISLPPDGAGGSRCHPATLAE